MVLNICAGKEIFHEDSALDQGLDDGLVFCFIWLLLKYNSNKQCQLYPPQPQAKTHIGGSEILVLVGYL